MQVIVERREPRHFIRKDRREELQSIFNPLLAIFVVAIPQEIGWGDKRDRWIGLLIGGR